MNIQWSPTNNFSAGRNGRQVIAIVNHITAGSASGALAWMKNPASQASAHFHVSRAGTIDQLVKEEDTAWHAGIVNKPNWSLYDGTNPNRYTLGIEHECLSGGDLTEPQYQATLWLHRMLIVKHGIPVDADHIIGHYRIDSVNRPNCPGPNFPWARLLSDLGGMSMKLADLNTPIQDWEIPAIQRALAERLLTQMHDPREVVTMAELSSIMLNLMAKLQGGR